MGFRKARTNVILAWMKTQHTKHVTYKLAYDFVWCPKYRKRILTGKIAACVEQEIHGLCETNGWTLGALNLQEDHVHVFLSAPPAVAPSQSAQILKGATARSVFQRFVFREEAVMGWCVLVSFILCWERGGYE
jgi:REP element-mobilizing transposase RayT